MNNAGSCAPTGDLGMKVIRGAGSSFAIDPDPFWPTLSRQAIIEHGLPRKGLPDEVNVFRTRNIRHLWRGVWRHQAAKALHVGHMTGLLWMNKVLRDGTVIPLGLASMRVVTDVGVGYIVDAFQNIVELENMKFHGYGIGSTAEAAANTALVTELTTEYVGNVRPTGTTVEGATANIYRTVATLTPDSGGSIVLREHGVFSANAAGVLLDRTVFAAVTLDSAAGDSLQTTYELTLTSGS